MLPPSPIRAAAACSLAAVIAVSAGCASPPPRRDTSQDPPLGGESLRLGADLPPEVRVPAVVAAARTTLLERGYAVQDTTVTEEAGEVTALPPGGGWFDRVVVSVRQSPKGTRVRITSPLGQHTRSSAVLDGVLARLGR